MPSTLLGGQPGGVPLVSGNPWSGRPIQPKGIFLKNSISSSGIVYIGTSGGLTIASGGALASGGLLDGFELSPGNEHNLPQMPVGGPQNVYATVATDISGRARVFWQVFPNG